MERKFIKTFLFGDYYCPAIRRYDQLCINCSNESDVGCDMCLRKGLVCCVSRNKIDLCMDCVCEIERRFERGDISFDDY